MKLPQLLPKFALFALTGILMVLGQMAHAQDKSPFDGPPTAPEIPFLSEWIASPHANWKAEAFNHWNEDGAVEEACAKCHSGTGFQDFLGADGTTPGKVDHPAPLGSLITCVSCHNAATIDLTSVTFPSGMTVKRQGNSARCMQCHQGRQAGADVQALSKDLPLDEVSDKLKFLNVHYRAAGATLMGTLAKGAYEFDGKQYAGPLVHKEQANQCIECHNPHSTDVKVQTCTACHREVISRKDLVSIRDGESPPDYDGDGNTYEGIAGEIDTLHMALYDMMKSYSATVTGKPVVYDAHSYPYFFNDNNANGTVDEGEAVYPNQYKSWTPRLLRAAYNYQFIAKDPGAYAHNPKYAVQILHDSISDLAQKVPNKAQGMSRPE